MKKNLVRSNFYFLKNIFSSGLLMLTVFFYNTVNAQPQLTFTSIIPNLSNPVDIKNAGDGSGRLFIVQQSGTIRIYKNGALQSKPFINLINTVLFDGEQGLLSIAFHPNYKSNRAFFVWYNSKNGNVTLARYRTSDSNADSADPASGVVLFSLPKPGGFTNHNGGCLQFGKDGNLFLSIGDGGSGGDPYGNAQNLQSLFGKLLRINVNVRNEPYYFIPPDNPFVNVPNARGEIFALGLRNTWRWSFDRQNGNAWLADVGQDKWEEVNVTRPAQLAGANYGWRCYEGDAEYNTSGCANRNTYRFPIIAYPHNFSNGGYSVIGGYVYRGNAYPSLKGYYICADYLSRNAWKIIPDGAGGWNISMQQNVPASLVSFGEDESGELYAAAQTGIIYRVGAQTAVASVAAENSLQAVNANYNNIFPTVVTNGKLTLVMKDNFKAVRITDMKGQTVLMQNLLVQTGVYQLSLPALSAGMYMIELSGDKIFRSKFLVQ